MTYDGILGLSNIDESSGDLIITQLYKDKLIDAFQFSILIAPETSPHDSLLTVGGYNQSLFQGNLIAHPVSGSFHWSLHLIRYSINGKWITPKASKALTDTGSTYIMMNKLDYFQFFKEMHSKLPETVQIRQNKEGGFYYINCDASMFSDLTVQIDEYTYRLPAEYYILAE